MAPPSSFAVSRKVNPDGVAPLTVDQLWKGLQLKSRNPTGFLPGVASCEILNDEGSRFTRQVTFEGLPPFVEEITEHEQTIIYFNVVGTERSITNIISHNENDELVLTFSFAGGLPGPAVTSDAPSSEELNKTVGKAVEHTLLKIRGLVKEGEI